MQAFETSSWRASDSAPRDGTRVLVLIGASEQGDADVDVAHWGYQKHLIDPCWVSSESSTECAVIYGEHEVRSWMPLPQWVGPSRMKVAPGIYELDGSGI